MTNEVPSPTPPGSGEQGSRLPFLLVGFALVGMAIAATILFADANTTNNTPATRPARVPAGNANAVVGWEVPPFEFEILDGELASITDYRGQVVFLNFWATWCIPCQREMPAFREFMAEEPEDAIILAVNNGEEIPAIVEFRELFQLDNVPIVLDPDFEISDGFGVVNLPVTYVINPAGEIAAFHLGEITREDMDAYLAELGAGA